MISEDVTLRYSTTTGPGDSTASDAESSLGEFVSSTPATATDLFPDPSQAECLAGITRYRCLFVFNDAAESVEALVYVESQGAHDSDLDVGVDTTAASAVDSASDQALEIVDEETAPVGVVFSAPTTPATALSLGTLASGQVRAFWLRQTIPVEAVAGSDTAAVRVRVRMP